VPLGHKGKVKMTYSNIFFEIQGYLPWIQEKKVNPELQDPGFYLKTQ
jgi:hypothetical protein